ncbi:hypothetical protein pipiens_007670 [Culex pipiens pipiens]|uniref:Enolase n=1 Tax=Culex pipiens pipiens TaxID=38569 RepID=A0ABD1DL66_CULPP
MPVESGADKVQLKQCREACLKKENALRLTNGKFRCRAVSQIAFVVKLGPDGYAGQHAPAAIRAVHIDRDICYHRPPADRRDCPDLGDHSGAAVMTVHHAADEPGRSAEAPDSRHFDGFLPDRFRKDEGLVVLIYHEQRNIVPYMIFKALKYAVLDRFTAKVVVREQVLAGKTLWPLQHLAEGGGEHQQVDRASRHASGLCVIQQKEIDELMLMLDETGNKSKLGANAILGVSLAVCKAGALKKGETHITELSGNGAGADL